MPELFGASSDFRNLEHRLETLPPDPGWESVTIINDSKSTSFVCTGTALASLEGPTRLLIGGKIKDRRIEDARPVRTLACVLSVETFGPEARWLADEAKVLFAANARAHITMGEAVCAALDALQPGETLLFSPGAASFDGFSSFSERGRAFKLLVKDYCSRNKLPSVSSK